MKGRGSGQASRIVVSPCSAASRSGRSRPEGNKCGSRGGARWSSKPRGPGGAGAGSELQSPPRGVPWPSRRPLAQPVPCESVSPCAWTACFGPSGLPQLWPKGRVPAAEQVTNHFGGHGIDAVALEIRDKGPERGESRLRWASGSRENPPSPLTAALESQKPNSAQLSVWRARPGLQAQIHVPTPEHTQTPPESETASGRLRSSGLWGGTGAGAASRGNLTVVTGNVPRTE
nr:uncharacterized protein LOC105497300 [Macaca nemestrina]